MTPAMPRLLVTALIALLASGLAQAAEPKTKQPDAPAKRMTDAVHEHVFESVLRLLPPGDALRLVFAARQRAAALSCEGFAVDNAKFRKVMLDITNELAALTPEGQNNLPVDVVMAGYNQTLGGQLAVAAYDKAAFCAESARLREELLKDTEGKVMILKPAE